MNAPWTKSNGRYYASSYTKFWCGFAVIILGSIGAIASALLIVFGAQIGYDRVYVATVAISGGIMCCIISGVTALVTTMWIAEEWDTHYPSGLRR